MIELSMLWHSRIHDDPGSLWLRTLIREAVNLSSDAARPRGSVNRTNASASTGKKAKKVPAHAGRAKGCLFCLEPFGIGILSSPSILTSGSPHPKAQRLFVTVAILFVAIAAGLGAFWLCTFFGTSDLRSVSSDRDADLVWLRREFDLTDAQFQRIRALHTAYAAKCDLMCQRIMNANAALDVAISRNKQVTRGDPTSDG